LRNFLRLIKKILKVDYPRGRAKGYYTNFISAQKLKIKFSLFTPLSSGSCRMTSPLNFRGEYIEPRGIPKAFGIEEFFSLKGIWLLNLVRRLWHASKYFNTKYLQILRWGITSKEDTNFTYNLTQDNITYLAQTIAVVTKKNYSEVIELINEAQTDKTLEKTIFNSIEKSSEKKFMDKEVRFGRRLGWYVFVRIKKPKIVVETGVDKGLGSILLCAALLKNKAEGFDGYYYGTDINPKAGFLLTGKYKEVGEILYGDSIKSLSTLGKKIDIFINDSDHSSDYEHNEYETIKPLIDKQTIILGDNAHSSNALSQFSLENNRNFLLFMEEPDNHWHPGGGIGISYVY